MKKKIIIFSFLLISATNFSAQSNGESLKRQAILEMQAKNIDKSIKLLDQYLSFNKLGAEGYNLRGINFEKKGQFVDAVNDFFRACRINPENNEYRTNLYKATVLRNSTLKNQIVDDSSNYENYLKISRLYGLMKKWKKAEEWFAKFISSGKGSMGKYILEYSNILAEAGLISEGEKILEKYESELTKYWQYWSNLGYFNLWMGKWESAVNNFKNAFKINPRADEIRNGLKAASDPTWIAQIGLENYTFGGIFSPEYYNMQKYFYRLENNPNDDNTRFLLVKELIDAYKMDEASRQIQYLKPNYTLNARYQNLLKKIEQYRNFLHNYQLERLVTKLKQEPADSATVGKISDLLTTRNNYSESEEILREYLELVPNDSKMRCEYAKILSADEKNDDAWNQIMRTIEDDPGTAKYKLIAGQIGLRNNIEYVSSIKYLQDYIAEKPDDINGLTTIGLLHIKNFNFEEAKKFVEKAEKINSDNSNVIQLKNMLKIELLKEESDGKIEILNNAREMAAEHKYDDAINNYEEFLDSIENPESDYLFEFANILAASKQYDRAISIYEEQLEENFTLTREKELVKFYLLNDDADKAEDLLINLINDYPDDTELKSLIGNAYYQNGQFRKAKSIFKNISNITPESLNAVKKLNMISNFKNDRLNSSVITTKITPFGNYFKDNLDLETYYAGIRLHIGILGKISLSGSWSKGRVNNLKYFIDYNVFKGNLAYNLDEFTSVTLGYGINKIIFDKNIPIYEASIAREKKSEYRIGVRYLQDDGAGTLFSPELVNNRLIGHFLKVDGYLMNQFGFQIFAAYNLIWTDKTEKIINNIGNSLLFSIGKRFNKQITAGYKYYFSDFKYNFSYYYTPQKFKSHGFWLKWGLYRDSVLNIILDAGIGYIPTEDFIERRFALKAAYKLNDNMTLSATGFYSNSLQDQFRYNSSSVNLNIDWNIF